MDSLMIIVKSGSSWQMGRIKISDRIIHCVYEVWYLIELVLLTMYFLQILKVAFLIKVDINAFDYMLYYNISITVVN